MSKSKIFVGICLSFALGIFLASRYAIDQRYIYGLAGFAIIIFALAMIVPKRSKAAVCLAGLFLFFVCLGILRFEQTIYGNQYQKFFNQPVKWEGYVVEDPDVRADRQLVTIQPIDYQQRILITTTKTQAFFYGDWVVLEGKIKEAKAFEDFDYQKFLERFDVYAVMSYPKVLILKSGQGNPIKIFLLKIKHAFSQRLQKFLKEPESSLALGILIGAKKGLPPEVAESFNITGTSHIVAISGFNIAVIVAALSFLAWIVGRRISFWLSFIIIIGFVIIAGASASVIRAAVMGVLLLMAFNIGRLYSVVPALCFAAATMLYINPKILYWDVGFQLSFAATFGLVLFMPLLDKLTSGWPKLWGLKNIFLATLSATTATLPLVLWYFGRLSLVSLLANILILPFVPFAMLFGFLTALPFLAPGFALLAYWLLTYILWVAQALASLPVASVSVEISEWILLMMIAGLAGIYWILRRWIRPKAHKQLEAQGEL